MSQANSRTLSSVKCSSCNVDMEEMGDVPFRTGGSRGAWKLFFGEWAELGEDLLNLDVFLCRNCGRVQLFADSKTRESLRSG